MRARIDGTEVYLSEDQLPEFTASINDILDPSSIKGTRSTTIRVIRTPEAARAVGSEYMAEETRNDRPTLRIADDSVDLFSATVVPVSRNRNEVELIAVGGNASWFELAKGQQLREFDFGLSEVVDGAMQVATWTDEDSLLYFPLIDFGAFDGNVPVGYLRPGLRAHRVIGDILAAGGWTLTPKGELADVWKKLVIIDPRVEPSRENPTPAPLIYNIDTATVPVPPYFVPSADGSLVVDLVDLTWVLPDPFNDEYDGVPFRVLVYDFTDNVELAYLDIPARYFGDPGWGSYDITHTFDPVQVQSGHNIGIAVQAMGLDGQERSFTLTIISTNYVSFNRDGGAQVLNLRSTSGGSGFELTDGAGLLPYAEGTRLEIAAVCPSMTLIQLIQAIGNALCLVWVTNDQTRTIEAWYDREYFRKPTRSITTRDWTDRLDITEAPEQIEPAKPRRLTLKYAADEDDRFLRRYTQQAGATYARADIDIPSGYANERSIDIPFAPSAIMQVSGLRIPRMHQYRGTAGEDNFQRTPRLFIADGTLSGNWTHGGTSRTVYPKVYFGDPTPVVALPFDNCAVPGNDSPRAIDTNWKRRLDELRYARVLECSVMLRDHEIRDFDHGMPTLLDDGSGPRWYYVQEIQGHRFGRREPTRVRLVEIPGAQLATRPLVNRVPVEYPEPVVFQCVGTGNATFVATDTISFAVRSSTGYVTLRNNATGVQTVYGSGSDIAFTIDDLTAGTYCMWSSNAEGGRSGVITWVADTEAAMTQLTIDRLTSLQQYSGSAPANDFDFGPLTDLNYLALPSGSFTGTLLDLENTVLTYIDVTSSSLVTVVPPSERTLQLAGFSDCALDAASVQAIIEACDPAHPNGALAIGGGTNASPSAEGLAIISKLEMGANMEVSGAGTSIANGEYELIGTANGRNSYDKVGGGPNISWDGTKWVLATTSGSYKAEQDVAEPWLATNWTTFGASAPAPSLMPPYAGGWVTGYN